MNTTERFVVYSGLAVAILVGVSGHVPGSSGMAVARPGIAADGPKVASIDVLAVVERMVSSETYKSQRDAYETEQAKKLQPLADEMKKIQEDAKDLKEESEKFKTLSKDFGEKNNQFQQLRSEAANQVEIYNTNQVGEAYRLVLEAATKLSDSLGYTHVFASKNGSATITSRNIPGAVQEMLARPLIKGVAADDLTERLIKELKLENVVVPSATAPAAAQPINAAPAKVDPSAAPKQ